MALELLTLLLMSALGMCQLVQAVVRLAMLLEGIELEDIQ